MPKDEITLEDRVSYLARIVGETLRFKHIGYSNDKVLWSVLRLHFHTDDLPEVSGIAQKQQLIMEYVCDESPLPRPLPLPSSPGRS